MNRKLEKENLFLKIRRYCFILTSEGSYFYKVNNNEQHGFWKNEISTLFFKSDTIYCQNKKEMKNIKCLVLRENRKTYGIIFLTRERKKERLIFIVSGKIAGQNNDEQEIGKRRGQPGASVKFLGKNQTSRNGNFLFNFGSE